MLSIDLSGKTALVTGATGELGRVMARTLARAGARLLLHYHRASERAARLEQEIRALGVEVSSVRADVGDAGEVERIAEQARASVGMPDVVVINAVQDIHPWSPVLEESIEDFESQFRTCVLQSVLLTKAFVPELTRRGWGRVIGINTECTMQMFETQSAYVAGKRGMDGVLRVLAREVGRHGITVNQVAPGWTISEKHASLPADDAEYKQNNPLRRRGTDQEVANVVAFLASDLASYIHGAFVPVCGGNVMPTV
jgi:3-oxoacyl-[acyl-carrier protein] reductase